MPVRWREQLGATLQEVTIADAVSIHFRDIGHDPEDHSVTYENAQARERTQVLMDIANADGRYGDRNRRYVGTGAGMGDLQRRPYVHVWSQCVRAEDAGAPSWSKYAADVTQRRKLREVLYDVLDTPVSPELLPPKDGDIAQKTEDLVGPYELHDFYPVLLCCVLAMSRARSSGWRWKPLRDSYDNETILKWLETFCRRFFSQQFKRSCLPDGPKVGTVALSPRGDWRMPSDACVAVWLKDLENISLMDSL